jgi:hypothetical protein
LAHVFAVFHHFSQLPTLSAAQMTTLARPKTFTNCPLQNLDTQTQHLHYAHKRDPSAALRSLSDIAPVEAALVFVHVDALQHRALANVPRHRHLHIAVHRFGQ